MDSYRFKLLRRWIVVVIGAGGAAFVALWLYSMHAGRQRSEENGMRELGNTAQLISEHTNRSFLAAQMVLMHARDIVEQVIREEKLSAEVLNERFKKVAGGLIELHTAFFVDHNGFLVAASNLPVKRPIKVADRDYFRHHAALSTPPAFISAPLKSRATGQWTITLTMAVRDNEGRFAGLVGTTVRLESIARFYDGLSLGAGSTITLVRTDGQTLMRYPMVDSELTRIVPADDPLLVIANAEGRGHSMSAVSPFDNSRRHAVFQRSLQFPVLTFVSRTEDSVLADWKNGARLSTVAVVMVLAGITMLGWLALRQLRQLENAIERSLHDPLTNLPNRRYFHEHARNEWRRALRNQDPVSVLFIDIDHFKRFNDRHGHEQGDDCLRQVGRRLQSSLNRAGDMVARHGGEEFVCLLPHTDLNGAERVASHLLDAIRNPAILHRDSPVAAHVTISIGIASTTPSEDAYSLSHLLAEADSALYAAKRAGRNRACTAAETSKLATLIEATAVV